MLIHYVRTFIVNFFIFILPVAPVFSQSGEQIYYEKLFSQAQHLLHEKKWQEAEIAYRQAIIFNKKSIEARKGLCQIALHSQDWPAFDRLIDEIFEISPENKETEILYKTYSKPYQITVRGDSLRILRKWNDAEKSYKKALKRDGNFKPALMGLGEIAYTRHNWKQVKRWFLQVLELQPGQEEAIYYLTTPPDAAVLHTVKRADSLFAAGNLKQAKREYKRALKKYAGVISAFRGLGRIAVREKYWVKVFLRFDQVLEIFPDDLEARYNEAVAYLEMAKFSPPLNSDKLLDIAEEKWNQLMQIDSTYSDVLYQRALVEKLRDNLTGAISWTKRQLRLKPDLAKANIGLLKIYREFLYQYQNVDVSLWPRLSNDGWTYYIIGEYHRRRFRLQQAETIFADLLNAHRLPSDVPIYLALTKLYIQKNDRNKAYEAYQHVQSGISSDLDAEFLFEATKYIFADEELKDFHALHGGQNKQAFFHTFWEKRNPLPVAQVDVRVIEHFRRLIFAETNYSFYGLRGYMGNPDKAGYLHFPAAYFLNDEFNDRGLIYIRHGKPDEIANSISAGRSNESWLYYSRADRSQQIFHFVVDNNALANDWRLTPFLTNKVVLLARAGWDPKLDHLRMAKNSLEANSVLNQIADENREAFYNGLNTDEHTWDKGTRDLDMPYTVASFLTDKGEIETDIFVGLPVAKLEATSSTHDGVLVDNGVGFYDDTWQEVVRDFNENENVQSTWVKHGAWFLRKYHFAIPPGEYNLSLYAKVKGKSLLGGQKEAATIPSFTKGTLMLSDLLPAYTINVANKSSPFVKKNLAVLVNPSKTFSRSSFVFLYYEIYGLTRRSGKTAYEVNYELTGAGKGKAASLSISSEQEGQETRTVEFTNFNVSELHPGKYTLKVLVRDLNSGTVAERSDTLYLTK